MPIPLIRPLMPVESIFIKQLSLSKKYNQYSNFGPNFNEAVSLLNKRTGRNVLPVTNGTVAIQLACQTTLYPGTRVVMPDFTHIGTYIGVKDAGMIPIFSSTNDKTWTLDLEVLAERADSFDAMVVVAPFGYAVNTIAYETFAAKFKKKIIYDFAGAWGHFPKTKFPVCYSLHATKGWTCGEGGLVSFSDVSDYETCRRLTNFNISPDTKIHSDFGGNYKLDEVRSAMIVAHLKRYDRIEERFEQRISVMNGYEEGLGFYPPFSPHASLAVFPWMLHVEPKKVASKFVCKFYFPKLTDFPHLKHVQYFKKSGAFFNTCLALPIDVTPSEQKLIIKEVNQ